VVVDMQEYKKGNEIITEMVLTESLGNEIPTYSVKSFLPNPISKGKICGSKILNLKNG
jgi:hypothetical protein